MSESPLPTTEVERRPRVHLPRGAMHFAFVLSMPSNNAWNGKWTGEDKVYARIRSALSRDQKERYTKLVGSHTHSFGDGWVACMTVSVVNGDQKKKLLKQSIGFCGYDWMITSLIEHGDIRV